MKYLFGGISWHSGGFPGGPSGKESTCQFKRCKRHGFDPWVGKMPWRRKWQPTPVCLPGKFHGQRSLVGYSPWGPKDSDTTEHTHTHTAPEPSYLWKAPSSLQCRDPSDISQSMSQIYRHFFCAKHGVNNIKSLLLRNPVSVITKKEWTPSF